MTPLQFHISKTLNPLIIEKFNIINSFNIPQLNQIQLTTTSIPNQITLFNLLLLLELISSQKANIIKAKKSIAVFNLRKKAPLGGKIILNGKNMEKLINKLNLLILPQINEFKGFKLANNSIKAVNLGIKEVTNFIEIEAKANKIRSNYGLTINILLDSSSQDKTIFFLNGIQIPITHN